MDYDCKIAGAGFIDLVGLAVYEIAVCCLAISIIFLIPAVVNLLNFHCVVRKTLWTHFIFLFAIGFGKQHPITIGFEMHPLLMTIMNI